MLPAVDKNKYSKLRPEATNDTNVAGVNYTDSISTNQNVAIIGCRSI